VSPLSCVRGGLLIGSLLIAATRRKLSPAPGLRPDYPLDAIGFGARIRYVIALAVEADDKHWSPMALADRLVGCEHRCVSALGRDVTDAFAEATVAELVGTAKKFD
jgi:hypothetical protein